MPISKQELKDLLSRDRADRVISEIGTVAQALEDQYFHNEIILISGKREFCLQAYHQGRISFAEFQVEMEPLRKGLLALIEHLPLDDGPAVRKTAFLTLVPPQLPVRIFPRPHITSKIRAAFEKQPFVLLHGPSGMGKTRLAEMFFHDYLLEYEHAGWFNTGANFATSFYLQADQSKIPAIAETYHAYKNIYQRPVNEVDAACAQVLSNFIGQECSGRKLLVVDGITQFQEILEPHLHYLRLTNTHVLICTQSLPSEAEDLSDNFPHELVEALPFSTEELQEMMLFYNLDPAFSDAAHHPVLKNPMLASVFLKNSLNKTPEHIRQLITRLEKVPPGEDFEHRLLSALFRAFDLAPAMKWVMLQYAAMPDLGQEPEFVARLLHFKSVQAPVHTNAYHIFKGQYRHDEDTIVHFDQILDWLSEHGWLVADENGEHHLHRAFVPLLQEQCKPRFDYFLEMAKNLELKFFLDENDWEEEEPEYDNFHLKRLSEESYEKHMSALFHLLQEDDSDDYLNLLGKYADLLHVRLDWEKEMVLREKVVSILERTEGEESERYLVSLTSLANVNHQAGQYQKALDCLKKALEIRKRFLSPFHPDLGNAYNNVGSTYVYLGDYEKALEYLEKALEISKQVLPPLHPNLATSYNNVGTSYGGLGDHEKALEFVEKALEIWKQVLPPLHPNLAASYNNVGGTYGGLGDHEKALEFEENALEIWKQVLPPLHPNLAVSYNNIGGTYGDLGDHEKALEYKEKALEIRKQVLPPLHPDLANSYNNVGGTYGDLGDHEKALEYQEKALEIRKQVLPPLHPNLAVSYNNVGDTYGDLGDHEKALEFEEKALEIRMQVLPPLHPDLASSYNNVGSTYGALGDQEKALDYIEKALEIRKQVLPPLHPDLASSYNNVGTTYGALGDQEKALEYIEKALEIRKQAL